jgi:peptidoglycan/LPS O-acetylase OafA/YrhL
VIAKPQLDALTGARGLAAWFVVIYHVRTAFSQSLPADVINIFAKGYLAVDLFFILSGFVMWLTYAETFRERGLRGIPDFMIRRIARIYPLHFVMLSATVGIAIVLTILGKEVPTEFNFAELPLHYLLLQNWGFTSELAWNDPSWSISTELGAYLFLPFLAIILTRRQMPVTLCIGLIVGLSLLLNTIFRASGHEHLGTDITGLGLIRCLIEFTCGVMVCIIWQQRHKASGKPVFIGSIIVSIASFVLWQIGLLRETLAIPIAFSALLYSLAITSDWRGNPLSASWAVNLGLISYATYLAHFLLWRLFKIGFVTDTSNVGFATMSLFFASVWAVSYGLYHVVEQPGRRWVQSLTNVTKAGQGKAA